MKKIIIMTALSMSILFTGIFGSNNVDAASVNQRVKAANIAQQYIGLKYVWGGTTPKGFDCSGLVQYSFKQTGVSLPRTAAQQYKYGKYVGKNGLRKGDMVFFNTTGGISHVGIYIGNNKFVHSSSSGLRVDSMNNSYWKPKFVGGKRI
ncbi:MAG: C40 family peptidase [Bacillus sp. (in: firmicutes)]